MSIWRALKLLLTIHCKESTEIMSASLDGDVSAVERWAARLHAMVCTSCRRFQRQLRFLQEAARQRAGLGDQAKLPIQTRDEILRQILPDQGQDS